MEAANVGSVSSILVLKGSGEMEEGAAFFKDGRD